MKEILFVQAPHHHFRSLDSTNNYASTIAKLPESSSGTAITAEFQENGRGQRDNTWEAKPNSSFLGTIILKVPIPTECIFFLSKWCAVQVADALNELQVKNIEVKWPNDIFVEGKKIGGILIENSWSDQLLGYSLLGIGINFLESPTDSATHLSKHISTLPTIPNFLSLLRTTMAKNLHLLETRSWTEIDTEYHKFLFRRNETHSFLETATKKTFQGKIIRVEKDGELIIELADKTKRGYYMKEVMFI